MVSSQNGMGSGNKPAVSSINDGASLDGLFARKLAWSRMVLFAERGWPRIWLPILVALAFVVASLFGLWMSLPYWAHIILLALFGLAFAASLVPLASTSWPSKDEALRRLEEKSGLPHRPASSYYDNLSDLSSPPQSTLKLWRSHRARMATLLRSMNAGWPAPNVQKYDPYAIRIFSLLLLPMAAFWAGDSWMSRIQSAFHIQTPAQTASALRLDAWITPPLYTGKPPLLINDGARAAPLQKDKLNLSDVPENSKLVIRINGAAPDDVRVLMSRLAGQAGAYVEPAEVNSDAPLEYSVKIDEPLSVNVTQAGHSIFKWNFNVVEDLAPKIALIGKPEQTVRGALKLGYEVEDDYGVAEARAYISLVGAGRSVDSVDMNGDPEAEQQRLEDPDEEDHEEILKVLDEDRPLGEPPVFALSLPRSHVKKAKAQTFKDLTSHPWAGLEVVLTLGARDQAGQETKTAPIGMILPSREFLKPLARAIIEQRGALVSAPKRNREKVATALDALTFAPENFIDDKIVYLGLRSVYWRLKNGRGRESVVSSVEQLWDIAIRIEDGDLADTMRALRLAKQNLEQALKNGADDAEIQKAIDELRKAIAKYLESLAKQQAAENLGQQQPQNGQGENNLISPQDLDQMLKNIENLARSGSKETAQQMLNQLNNILENLQAQRQQQQQNGQAQEMMKSLNELGEMIQRQQQLLDESHRRQGEGQQRRGGERQAQEGRRPGQQGGQGQQRGRQGRQGQQRGEGQQQGERGRQAGRGQLGQQPGRGMQPGQQGRQGQGPGQQFGQGQTPQQQGQSGQPGAPSGQGQSPFGGLSQQQGALRERLNKLLEDMRAASASRAYESLEGAGSAMGDATRSLDQGDIGSAAGDQSQALDQLRKGAEALAQQMMQSMQQQSQGGNGGQRDPLGRRPQGSQGRVNSEDVEVPDEVDIQRARQILEELRERLSDPTRPVLELDYIERLLRRF